MNNKQLLYGIDALIKNDFNILKNKRIGLLANQASITSQYNYTFDIIPKFSSKYKYNIISIFSPQHGLFAVKQANMIESKTYFDKDINLKIISLYGEKREPDNSDLKNIDAVVIDLFDIGTRYYTFMWTIALMMKKCEELNIEIIILDRPNPINGLTIEGNIQENDFFSFVGLYPIPVRHSLTIGEIGLYLKQVYFQKLNLNIIKMTGYKRKHFFTDYKICWPYPSPNMPAFESALTYPGMCLFEGTNISEGRGTTLPFQMFGAPWINEKILTKKLNNFKLPGVYFRSIKFSPTFDKYKNKICNGAFLHVTDNNIFSPYKTGIIILDTIKKTYSDKFKWLYEPYEYEYTKPAIDILCGTNKIRNLIDNKNLTFKLLKNMFEKDENTFKNIRKEIALYK